MKFAGQTLAKNRSFQDMAQRTGLVRWVLLVPGAVLGSLAAEALIGAANSELPLIAELLMAAVGPFAFVFVGTHLAPYGKAQAALCLAVAYALISLALLAGGIVYDTITPRWLVILLAVIRTFSATLTSVFIRRDSAVLAD